MLCGGLSLYYLQQAEKSQNERQQLNYYWLAGLFFSPLEHYDALSALVLSKKLLDMPIGSSQHEEMAGLALKKINAAIDKVPLNARNYATKAGILQTMRADSTSVVEEYEHALTNTPFDFGIRYDYAHFLVATQQTSKALTVLWGAWGGVNAGVYKDAIKFLKYQLELKTLYGNPEDNTLIEQQIQHLANLQKQAESGVYVFKK